MKPNTSAPFRNVPGETRAARVARVAAIGRRPLLDWWETMKGASYPSTYGDSGCGFASAVAYMLANGGPSRFQVDNPDLYRDQLDAYRALTR